jgi:hypothetical protein
MGGSGGAPADDLARAGRQLPLVVLALEGGGARGAEGHAAQVVAGCVALQAAWIGAGDSGDGSPERRVMTAAAP